MAISYLYNEKSKTIHIRGYCPAGAGKAYPSLKKAMEASGGEATICKRCQQKKEQVRAEEAQRRKSEKQAALAKEKEEELRRQTSEAREADRKRREKEAEEETKKKNREKEQRIRAAEWEEHMKKRRKLRCFAWILAAIGAIAFVIGLINGCQGGKDTSIWLIVIMGGFFAVWIGFFILKNYPDNGQNGPLPKPIKASQADQAMLYKVQAIQNMPTEIQSQMLAKISAEYSADIQREWQAEKTKKAMIKGAVVGGIVGGDAGAVVGAMIAKEKSEK